MISDVLEDIGLIGLIARGLQKCVFWQEMPLEMARGVAAIGGLLIICIALIFVLLGRMPKKKESRARGDSDSADTNSVAALVIAAYLYADYLILALSVVVYYNIKAITTHIR